MNVGFRRGRPERASGRIGVLSLLPSVPPGEIGSGNPITGVGGQTVTVTRATTRYCYSSTTPGDTSAVTSIAVNAPALEANGLSIENAHTNLLLRSEEFDNASWTKAGGGTGTAPTVSANTSVAPNGTTTADRIQCTAIASGAANNSLVGQVFANPGVGIQWTFSIWVKGTSGAGSTRLILVETGTIRGAVTVNFTTTWQRFSVTSAGNGGGVVSVNIGAYGADLSPQSAADFQAWGAQVETGEFAHSYVPTTTATATCNQDIVVMSGHGSLPVAKGSVEVDITPLWTTLTPGGNFVETRSGAGSGGLAVFVAVPTLTFEVINSGTIAAVVLVWVPGTTYRIKAQWGAGVLRLYRDGVLRATSVTDVGNIPTVHSILRLGNNFGGNFALEGNLKNMRWYK